jgi:hypothetical protein
VSSFLLASVLAAFDLVGESVPVAVVSSDVRLPSAIAKPRHHGGALLGDSTRDGIVHAYDRIPSLQTL